MTRSLLTLALTLLAILLVACGGGEPTKPDGSGSGSTPAPAAVAALPADLQIAEAPKEPLDVQDARTKTKEGQEVFVRGRIGGYKNKTFIAGKAAFVLADADGIIPCNLRPGDKCITPWDYCCDTQEDIVNCTIPVQIHGADGKPLPVDIKGWKNLRELSVIVVKGTIKKFAGAPMLIATGIYIESAEPHTLPAEEDGGDGEDGE